MDVKGKKVVLTGALTTMTRAEATEKLEDLGAIVTKSVTSKTEVLFIGDRPGSKLEKAEGYGIPIYNESKLSELFKLTPPIVSDLKQSSEVLQEIEEGEIVEVQGSAMEPYLLKNIGGVYSCNCPAWRNQSAAIDKRTCKHLQRIRGEEAEAKRVGGSTNIRRKAKGSAKPKILLAKKWESHIDPTEWWMSEKLDGVRAYWTGDTFFSRSGNEYLAPAWFTEGLPTTPLDGELWIGRGDFQKTVSIVRRQDRSDAWKDVKFIIFDAPDHGGVFEERYEFFYSTFSADAHAFAHALQHDICESIDHLQEELARVEALRGEGLMLRQAKSNYVGSRSSTLLKVKTFHDAEAKVEGYMDGQGKHRNRVGSLKLITPKGVRFSCGSGLSDAEREDPPEIGTIVSYRFQELTDAGIPRFPTYVGVRIDAEWPEDGVRVLSKISKKSVAPKKKKAKSKKSSTTSEVVFESTSGLRRFEYIGGSSNKFWEISISENSHTVCYGKITTKGTCKTKSFADVSAAEKDAARLVLQKEGKGYKEV